MAGCGYLAVSPGGSGAGVLVLHAWWGLTDLFTGVCDRLTAAGFIAFVPDLYDGPTATTIEGAEQLMEASDEARSRAIAEAAVAYLRAQPGAQAGPLGAVGFSMGAGWAFALSALRPDDLAAVRALEDQIRAAGREVAFHLYPGTRHWFVEDNRPDAYDAAAARLAWERTLRFLRAHLE